MAQDRFIMRGGERIMLTDNEPIYDWRCDGCGEYLAAKDLTTLTITIMIPGRGQVTRAVNAHPAHLAAAMEQARNGILTDLGLPA